MGRVVLERVAQAGVVAASVAKVTARLDERKAGKTARIVATESSIDPLSTTMTR